jgi:hypothetical protein
MTGFEWTNRISSDDEVVDRFLYEGTVTPQPADIHDMNTAIEWLALYSAENSEEAQAYANVIGLLEGQIKARQSRKATNEAKRQYAHESGIPFKQLRIKK